MSTSEKKTLSDEIYDYFHDYPKSSLNSRSEIVDGVWVLEAEVARLGDDNARLKRELGEMELDYEDAERGYGLAHKQLAKLGEQLAEAQEQLKTCMGVANSNARQYAEAQDVIENVRDWAAFAGLLKGKRVELWSSECNELLAILDAEIKPSDIAKDAENVSNKAKPAERGEVMSKESRNVDTLDSSGYRVDMSDNVECAKPSPGPVFSEMPHWVRACDCYTHPGANCSCGAAEWHNARKAKPAEPSLSEQLEAWYKDSVMHFTSSEEEAEFDAIVTAIREMEKAK